MLKRILKIFSVALIILVVLVLMLTLYVRKVSILTPPQVASMNAHTFVMESPDSGLTVIGNNWFKKSESGLYELYIEGSAYERGVVNGMLTRELVQYQEQVFTQQIHQMVPSDFYLSVLKHGIGFFNRKIDQHVPAEYLQEIYGVSQAASPEFNDIAPAYQRMLNYHAAHDIGHALQNMSLVGCTSFATWGSDSEDGSLIIGRNFDFYVGDDFARDKIVAFYNPEKGHRFMMITFGGMTGVLSGMNTEGLTVTINAAKSDVPSSAAMPVSLVAREILQYASTISEAYAIAEKRQMFVAESFLIGSAKDGKAAIIEKTPDAIDIFNTSNDNIVCTNHFQTNTLGKTDLNKEHMRTSASPYRYARVVELLSKEKNSVVRSASILRNQKGKDDDNIGLGNEKLINQLVAHHGIIFQPEKGLVWISTAPWQLGKFVCYDIHKVFDFKPTHNKEITESDKVIAADSFLYTPDYSSYVKFSKYRFPFNPVKDFIPDSLIRWNPNSYHAYMLAADAYFDKKRYAEAKVMYEVGLTKETATLQEYDHMKGNLQRCNEKLK